MITELVLFDLPEGMTRPQFLERYWALAPRWQDHPGLLRRNVLFDAGARQGGGMYLWADGPSADRWHDAQWRQRMIEAWGGEPHVRRFDTPMVVDHQTEETFE